MLTPTELDILVHFYVSAWPHPRCADLAVKEAIEAFIDDGVMHDINGVPTVTEKGDAWLQEILSTPQPRQAWVNGAGKVISIPMRGS